MKKQCILILVFVTGFKIYSIGCQRNDSYVCINPHYIFSQKTNASVEHSQQIIDWVRNGDKESRSHNFPHVLQNSAQHFCQKQLARKNLLLADYKRIFNHSSFSSQELHQIALHSFDHYRNPQFQLFLKSLPEFESFAQELISKEQNRESSSLDHLEPLHKQYILFFCTQTLRNNERKRITEDTRQKRLHQEKEEVQQLYNYYNHLLDHEPLSRNQEERYVRRIHALAQVLKDNGKKEMRKFNLTRTGKDALAKSNIELNKFIKMCGSNAQIELHEECISLVEHVAQQNYHLKSFPDACTLNHAALECTDVVIDYNKVHKLDKAYKVADFAWALADYGYAVVQGISDGIVSVTHQVMHPIQTTKAIIESLGTIGATMAAVLCEVCDINSWPERAEERSERICKQITDLYNVVKKKWDETSGRDRVRAASRCVTEWYLPIKCLKIVLPICRRGVVQAQNRLKCAPEFARNTFAQPPFATTAGPDAHICDAVVQNLIKKMGSTGQRHTDKIKTCTNKTMFPGSSIIPNISLENPTFKGDWEVIGFLNGKPKNFLNKIASLEERLLNGLKNKNLPIKLERPDLKHMFAIDMRKNLKTGKIKFTGFHSDYGDALEKLGIFKYANKIVHPKYGVIKGDLLIDNVLKPGHTMFPPAWSEEKVIDAVLESLDNVLESVVQFDEKLRVIGETKTGMRIKSIIGINFFNSFPIF